MPNQSHITVLHQCVSITPVTNICVPYNNNTLSISIIVQNFKIKPLAVHLISFSESYDLKNQMITFLSK
jgi:hypothetical protein